MNLADFHFLRPHWFIILLPIVLAIYLNWRKQEQAERWQQRIPAHLLKPLLTGKQGWQQRLPLLLAIPLLIGYLLVLAGPSWQRQVSPFNEDHSPLVILLDLSPSMLQADVTPNRLERAKFKIQQLLSKRGSAQTALIAYAGSAHTVLPMTTDPEVFVPMLQALSPEIMPAMGKDAATARPLLGEMFENMAVPATVLLLTDAPGFTNQHEMSAFFRDSPHQLLVLGVGQEEPLSSRFTPLEATSLQRLAESSGGDYASMTLEDDDVHWVLRRMQQHLVVSADSDRPWQDAGYYLLFPMAVLALLWFRKGWIVQWCLLLVVTGGLYSPQAEAATWRFADLWLTQDQQARLAFDDGDFVRAAQGFEDPMWKGFAYYQAHKFAQAEAAFATAYRDAKAEPSGQPATGCSALFAMAAAQAHQLQFPKAIKSYQKLLAEQPGYPGAQENIDTLVALIEALKNIDGGDNALDSPLRDRSKGTTKGSPDNTPSYSAQDLMMDPALADKWMREVQPNPAKFLQYKFKLQHSQNQAHAEQEQN